MKNYVNTYFDVFFYLNYYCFFYNNALKIKIVQ